MYPRNGFFLFYFIIFSLFLSLFNEIRNKKYLITTTNSFKTTERSLSNKNKPQCIKYLYNVYNQGTSSNTKTGFTTSFLRFSLFFFYLILNSYYFSHYHERLLFLFLLLFHALFLSFSVFFFFFLIQ